MLVTADVVGLYPSIPHESELRAQVQGTASFLLTCKLNLLPFINLTLYAQKVIIFCQTVRISRLCSAEKDLENHKEKILSAVIDEGLSILYMDKDVKRVFTLRPMVLFRSALKLNSYLVKAKLYPLERTVDPFKCKSKRCQVCNNPTEADSFTCSNSD